MHSAYGEIDDYGETWLIHPNGLFNMRLPLRALCKPKLCMQGKFALCLTN
jgi:hypothetical protein